MLRLWRYILPALLLLAPFAASATETDQYLTWGVELADSTEPFNRFLNEQVEAFLVKANKRGWKNRSREELTQDLYLYLFQGLHMSRLRGWLRHSEEVDRYPDKSVSYLRYQRMSIYRAPSFPYILPMARTVRLNNVYLGIDKIGHVFGFGRRYYKRYLRYRAKGLSDEEATERVIRWGIHLETTFVGTLVDGIFSRGDLEADYQGFLLAKNLCGGDDPHVVQQDGRWTLVRPIDIRPYITPQFDESYNRSSYWGLRRRHVLRVMKKEYWPKLFQPDVQQRFAAYDEWEPSLSSRILAAYYRETPKRLKYKQFLDALSAALSSRETSG